MSLHKRQEKAHLTNQIFKAIRWAIAYEFWDFMWMIIKTGVYQGLLYARVLI